MIERPSAPATERNRDAILEILSDEFRDRTAVFEIGSGTGQHAIYIARQLRHLTWQTSDRVQNHAAINAWIESSDVVNVLAPLPFDVEAPPPLEASYDVVFSANTAHIMSDYAVRCMFALVGNMLHADGIFCLYGPFKRNGSFTSDSNARFDASLRDQDSLMGIRNLEDLDRLAEKAGMRRTRLYAMPANNFMALWCRGK